VSRLPTDLRGEHTDPKDYPDLLKKATSFKSEFPSSRFALLRIWSSPYFYPLMLGHNNRNYTSFIDGVGRCWEWKFVTKDMHGSEWSIYYTLQQLLQKFKRELGVGTYVVQRRDIILVMGETEEDLMRRVLATTFAVQARPWLREIDLWRSFVNVKLGFLEGLDEWWLD